MRKKTTVIIFVVFFVLVVAFIFGNSFVKGFDSYKITCKIINFCLSITDKMGDFGKSISAWFTIVNVRKTAHFIEYAILGIICVAFRGSREPMTLNRVTRLLLIGIGVPFLDETIQLFVNRSSLVSDMWIDLFGFATGAIITSLFFLIKRRKRAKNKL